MKNRKCQNSFQEEDTSNEGDTAVSYDGSLSNVFFSLFNRHELIRLFLELSEHDSDDSLSQIQNNPTGAFADVITRSTHPSSTELIPFDSSFSDTNHFRSSSFPSTNSTLLPTNSFSSSSSSLTINDDQTSSSDLDFCTLVSTTNYGHHHWLGTNQS